MSSQDEQEQQRRTLETVAATLRTAANWLPERHRDMLRRAADNVDGFDASDDWCCPVCEEVVCDHGCPLDGIRPCDMPSAHSLDASSGGAP